MMIEVNMKSLFRNLLGVVIFSISFFDWISYVALGWKLTSLAYWINVVFMIVGIGILFYNPEKMKRKDRIEKN